MPISLECPHCSTALRLPDGFAGKSAQCPACARAFAIATGERDAPFVQAISAPGSPVTAPETFERLWRWVLWLTIGMISTGSLTGMLLGAADGLADKAVPRKPAAEVDFDEDEDENDDFRPQRRQQAVRPPANSQELLKTSLALKMIATLPGLIFLICLVGLTIASMVLLYKEWDLIQDGEPQTTPGQAVGLLFIPFFRLYWNFVAIKGLAADLNRYADERGVPARRASEGLATAAAILEIVVWIPCVGGLVAIPLVVIYLLAFNSIKNTAADIAAAKLDRAGRPEPVPM